MKPIVEGMNTNQICLLAVLLLFLNSTTPSRAQTNGPQLSQPQAYQPLPEVVRPAMQAPHQHQMQLQTPGQVIQRQEQVTLDSVLHLAAANNPTLRQARLHISATLAQAQQAGLYPNPSLNYLGENIGAEGTAGEFQGAEIRQRFVTANKLELSRSKYLQRAQVAEHLAVAQQFKVCNDVRLHFIQTLAAQSILKLQQELLKTAEDNLLTVQELYNLGQANQVDMHRAKAELRRHKLGVLSAENSVRRYFIKLSSLVGVELRLEVVQGELNTKRELIDFDAAYHRILAESPELLAAHAKLREDGVVVQRESVQWVPDIVVSAGPGYNFEADDAVANLGISMELPIFDRNQGTIRQAQSDYGRQQGEIRRTEMALRSRLADEYERYLNAVQHTTSYEDTILPEMRAAYETILQSYKADRAEWPDVLEVYREYTMRRIEYIEQLMNQRMSEILIDGYLLHGGLEAAPNATPPGHIDATPRPR